MFVTAENFELDPYSLPNLVSDNSFFPYVEREEKSRLRKILGGLFYDAFIEGMEGLPSEWEGDPVIYAVNDEVIYGSDTYKSLIANNTAIIPGSDPTKWELQPVNKWLTLKNGKSYVHEGIRYDWVGMELLFTPYIYYMRTLHRAKSNVGAGGIAETKLENAVVINPGAALADAWNEFEKMLGDQCSFEDTLYGYLYNSGEDFQALVEEEEYDSIQSYLRERFCGVDMQNPFGL